MVIIKMTIVVIVVIVTMTKMITVVIVIMTTMTTDHFDVILFREKNCDLGNK